MCVNCGGKCGSSDRPRFLSAPGPVDLSVKGTAASHVDQLPGNLISTRGRLLTYETLYTALTPEGQPAAATIPGTFGQYTTRAQVGR